MVIEYHKVYVFSVVCVGFFYALSLGVLGNVCFTNAKQVGKQRKSVFVYGILPVRR